MNCCSKSAPMSCPCDPRCVITMLTGHLRDTEAREEVAVIPALALGATQNPSTTMRPGTPKLAKHQTMTMTSLSRSTGRSDKARRAQGMKLYSASLFVRKQIGLSSRRSETRHEHLLAMQLRLCKEQSHHYIHFVWTSHRIFDSTQKACYAFSCAQHDCVLVLSTQAWLAEQHEQDMLEELDRMHEECATLHEDAKVGFTAACQFQCHNFTHWIAYRQSLGCICPSIAWDRAFILTCTCMST